MWVSSLEHLQIPWFALFLNPRENAARKLGKVVHGHLLVEGLEQGVHEHLHLKRFHYWSGNLTHLKYLEFGFIRNKVLRHRGCLFNEMLFNSTFFTLLHISSFSCHLLVSLYQLLVVGSHDLEGNHLVQYIGSAVSLRYEWRREGWSGKQTPSSLPTHSMLWLR